MGKIYCMMGKSSTGKDTLYKRLLEDRELSLKTLIPYTTRPIRDGETDGVEYFFCDEAKLQELEQQGRIVELHAHNHCICPKLHRVLREISSEAEMCTVCLVNDQRDPGTVADLRDLFYI